MNRRPSDSPPTIPRPAATLLLARDGPDGPETLLVRRSSSARFVPGAYVFPGGVVDEGDASDAALEPWDGLSPEEARRRLGLAANSTPPAIAYFVAALRETFEETGLLPGRAPSAAPPSALPGGLPPTGLRDSEGQPPIGLPGSAPAAPADAPHRSREGLDRARTAVLEGRLSFPSLLRDHGIRIDGRAFAYIARWVTPPSVARRYDTRFFAALAPPRAEANPDDREATHAAWLTPARALALRADSALSMIFPTASTLEDCTGFATADQLVSHLRRRAAVNRSPDAPLPDERTALGLPEPDG